MRETITVVITLIMTILLIVFAVIGSRWCEKPQQQEQIEQASEVPPDDELETRQTEVIELVIIEAAIRDAEARLKALYRKSEEHVDGEG